MIKASRESSHSFVHSTLQFIIAKASSICSAFPEPVAVVVDKHTKIRWCRLNWILRLSPQKQKQKNRPQNRWQFIFAGLIESRSWIFHSRFTVFTKLADCRKRFKSLDMETHWLREKKATKDNNEEKKGGEKSTTGKLRGWQKSCNSATTLSCRFQQHEITCWRPKSVNFSAENYPHVANSFSFARPVSDSDSYYFATICTLSHACMHR